MFIHKPKASKNATSITVVIFHPHEYTIMCSLPSFKMQNTLRLNSSMNFGLANDLSTDGTKHFKFVTNRFFIHYGKLLTVITTVLIGAHTPIANSTNFSPGARGNNLLSNNYHKVWHDIRQ